MKRILYFTGYRMVAQEWLGRSLNSSVYFEPDEQGLDLFTSYLASLKGEPVKLLVDLIEEEFRKITIPVTRGADRNEMINRNFSKYFRNSDYRHSKSQYIVKKERKEENLLLMGLTNQYLLKPWLTIIEQTRTPLSGIVSLPLVSEEYVKSIKDENRCVILVSQQVPSNLRQSVFINGKLILSRLVPIASFYQGDYATDIVRDAESTQRYLFSQRIIDRSEMISVHIISNKRHFDKLTIKCASSTDFDYHIYNIDDVLADEKIDVSDEQDFSSALFCQIATRNLFANHYARSQEKKYFLHYLGSLVLKVLSVCLVAGGIGLFSTSIAKGFFYQASIDEMEFLEQKYKTKFNQLSETRIDSTASTATMQDVVVLVDEIESKYQLRPDDFLILVSQHLSLFESVRLSSMDWFVSRTDDLESVRDLDWGGGDVRSKRSRSSKRSKELYEIAIVNGEFLNFDGDYRFALSAVDDLENAIKVSGQFDSVNVLKRPLDVEPENRLSGNAGFGLRQSTKKAEFSLRIVRKVDTNEK